MLAAGQAEYLNDTRRPQDRVRARLDDWAVLDSDGLNHLKDTAGLTLVALQEDMVHPPRPLEVIRITIDKQISDLRIALTWKQKQRSESRYKE
jgi:hypothetical protein